MKTSVVSGIKCKSKRGSPFSLVAVSQRFLVWTMPSFLRAPMVNLVKRPKALSLSLGAGDGVLQRKKLFGGESLRTQVEIDNETTIDEWLSWSPGYAYWLAKADLNVPTGLTFIDQKVVAESNSRPGDAADFAAISRISFASPPIERKELWRLLSSDRPKLYLPNINRNVHQWLSFGLPIAVQVKKFWPDTLFLVDAQSPGFFIDELVDFGLSIATLPRGTFSVRNLLVCEGRRPFLPHTDQISELKRFFLGSEVSTGEARIFLSRVGSSRSFEPEQDLESLLRQNDWIIMRASDFGSLAATARLFSGASVIAGLHGAGLTNLLFSDSRVQVTELVDRSFWKPSYARISNYLGQGYSAVPIGGNSAQELFASIQRGHLSI